MPPRKKKFLIVIFFPSFLPSLPSLLFFFFFLFLLFLLLHNEPGGHASFLGLQMLLPIRGFPPKPSSFRTSSPSAAQKRPKDLRRSPLGNLQICWRICG